MKQEGRPDVKPVYLSSAEVARFVSLSPANVQKLVRENQFPKPRLLSANRVGWLTHEVEDWAEARPVSNILPPTGGGRPKKN